MNVSIPLSLVVDLLTPPEEVSTVPQYRDYIAGLLRAPVAASASVPGRGPGRPLKYLHPAYSETEWRALKEYCRTWLSENEPNIPPKFAQVQPDDPAVVVLENGQTLNFAGRVGFGPDPIGHLGMVAIPLFPPSIGDSE